MEPFKSIWCLKALSQCLSRSPIQTLIHGWKCNIKFGSQHTIRTPVAFEFSVLLNYNLKSSRQRMALPNEPRTPHMLSSLLLCRFHLQTMSVLFPHPVSFALIDSCGQWFDWYTHFVWLHMSALRWTGDLSRVTPPLSKDAELGSSLPKPLTR